MCKLKVGEEGNFMDLLERLSSKELDQIIGKQFKILDDGFVRVIDYMGNDEAVVQAARVSYGKGTKKINEDRGLIRYLLRHKHTTPFEMCEIKLHVRVPMDTWRQWIRHRTANVNEYSTRYSVAIDSMQETNPDEWRMQSNDNKQGSNGVVSIEEGKLLSEEESEFHKLSQKIYNHRIEKGVAREQARKDLPLSTYTEAYWKIDLHNLLHFLSLRMHSHAQLEIRSYANVIGEEIVKRWCPLTWEAFIDYNTGSISFSKLEIEIIRFISSGDSNSAIQKAIDYGMLNEDLTFIKKSREREELEMKLRELNLQIPWLKS
jgi:thymidylate synthase (FAD)